MRALPPTVAELARGELSGLERPRGHARAHEAPDARDHPPRRVRRPRRARSSRRCATPSTARSTRVRSMPRMLAMALVQRDLGPRSPWGRFRLAVERFDALLLDLVARRRAAAGAATRCSRCCSSSATRTATRPPTATCATSSWRCWWPATTPRRRRWPGRSSGSPATPRSTRACATATPPTSRRWSRRSLRARPALTIAPRRLTRAGHGSPATRCPPASTSPPACGWRCAARTCGRRPPRSAPSAGSRARRRTRCRGSPSAAACAAAPGRRSPRWRCARCCARPLR